VKVLKCYVRTYRRAECQMRAVKCTHLDKQQLGLEPGLSKWKGRRVKLTIGIVSGWSRKAFSVNDLPRLNALEA